MGDPESIQIQKVNKEISLLYEDLEWTLDSEMKGLNLLNPEESVFWQCSKRRKYRI